MIVSIDNSFSTYFFKEDGWVQCHSQPVKKGTVNVTGGKNTV